jgi:hypothetical protein
MLVTLLELMLLLYLVLQVSKVLVELLLTMLQQELTLLLVLQL